MSLLHIIGAIIVVALFLYLIAALLGPENFS